ncbi:sialic acid-binding Ig-like lectin 14 [Dunckerocampus dactyliophorus]|uniref:sialic acid-binding Ig-like lectin 14 n=1 Tax=Dunckerocampus dactyliophorus TaxID=161453 RepID=UPI0024062A9A|nr:sialic acid-binding Ig-like lectin 14 [Dunckerocampus dactyliophorus]
MVYDGCTDSYDNPYSLVLTGTLDQQNCTTVYNNMMTQYSGSYFFRLYNHADMVGKLCEPVEIKVEEQPLPPTIDIPPFTLKENQSIKVSCSVYTPCPTSPPVVEWRHCTDNQQRVEQLPDGTFTTKLDDTLTLMEKHNGYILQCSCVYRLGRSYKLTNSSVTLNVLFAPKDTVVSVSPSGPVPFGTNVMMSCSSRANPPSNFTWWVEEGVTHTPVAEGECQTAGFMGMVFGGSVASLVVVIALGLVLAWRFRWSRLFALRPAQREARDVTMVAFNQDGVHFNGVNLNTAKNGVHAERHSDQQQESVHVHVHAVPNTAASVI